MQAQASGPDNYIIVCSLSVLLCCRLNAHVHACICCACLIIQQISFMIYVWSVCMCECVLLYVCSRTQHLMSICTPEEFLSLACRASFWWMSLFYDPNFDMYFRWPLESIAMSMKGCISSWAQIQWITGRN